MPVLRLVVLEVQHRLNQLDELGLLPASIRRFLLDENIPGASLTIVPELVPNDFLKLLENPTTAGIDYWIHKGERSVWPAVTALRIRCGIEFQIDQGYQLVRKRRRPAGSAHGGQGQAMKVSGSQTAQQERRQRAKSFEGVLKQ